jgi:hypothetical protein
MIARDDGEDVAHVNVLVGWEDRLNPKLADGGIPVGDQVALLRVACAG